MKHKIKYLRTEVRAVNLQSGAIKVIEDTSEYRGYKIDVTYTDRASDDMVIEARTSWPVSRMDGFETVREAMAWIDEQLDGPKDDGGADWLAYHEEHSLRSWQ